MNDQRERVNNRLLLVSEPTCVVFKGPDDPRLGRQLFFALPAAPARGLPAPAAERDGPAAGLHAGPDPGAGDAVRE